ncbi:uncharacterized protein LOC124282944, partial [Haliotis rubra]|uniref:uncharacterized protein LOC124282944 n=1 Tax=Haliotis rubra TaxID=36100 RepID=UPI001EE5A13A
SGKEIVRSSDFLCTTRTGNILVSDDSSERVLCLTAEGDVVSTYPTTGQTPLRLPRGITRTSTGDILVTDYDEHTVVHLTESGQFVRNILIEDDIALRSNGVCVDGRGRVYVCDGYTGEINVFSFSNTIGTMIKTQTQMSGTTNRSPLKTPEMSFAHCTYVGPRTLPPGAVASHFFFYAPDLGRDEKDLRHEASPSDSKHDGLRILRYMQLKGSKMTKVTSPERPIDEWADEVKPSFVIQGLLDSFGPGCKGKDQWKCESVVTLESELPALKSQLLNKKETISKKQLQMEARVDAVKVNVVSEKDRYARMEHDIKSFANNAREKITLMENKLLDELKEVSEKHIEQLTADLKSGKMSGCEAGDVDAVGDVDLKKRIAKIMLRQNEAMLSRALDDLQLVLPVNGTDTVVITDYNNNNSVKSLYTRNKQRHHSKLQLGSRPWGITRLKHNQVAVTVPHRRQVVTVEVNPDLVLLSTITTSKQYLGITSLTPSTLAAGSDKCVDILDMRGNVLKSIKPIDSGKEIIQSPSFLCTTGTRNILVSDDSSRRVLCLTAEGDVVFTYPTPGHTTLRYPRGITSASTGDILVTDYGEHTVAHLTESGQFVRNILTKDDGVSYPHGVCVDGRGRVYIGNYRSGEIKVFSFSNTK